MIHSSTSRPSLAIGNFDGVHIGHRTLLHEARRRANGGSVVAVTFEPHPVAFFRPQVGAFRLTPGDEKITALKNAGAHEVCVLPFTQALVDMSAKAFVEEILIHRLNAAHVAVGFNFAFGHNRAGNIELLKKYADNGMFGLSVCEAVRDKNGDPISSGRIRKALQDGECEKATAALGRPMRYGGVVARGDGVAGSVLNFPTANLDLGAYVRPKYGVYASRVAYDGESYPAAVNVGVRPTAGGRREWLEAHLLPPFTGDMYGKRIDVELLSFLREEKRFANKEALKHAIAEDVAATTQYFAQDKRRQG